MQTLKSFKQKADLSKCTEIISQSNFVLLRNVDENAVEKNLAGFSPNTRISNKRQKLAFFGVAKRWRIEFKNKCIKHLIF